MARPSVTKSENPLPARVDPPPRHTGGLAAQWEVLNKDPNRTYVWVWQGDKTSMTQYRMSGHRFETYRFAQDKDGKARIDSEGLPVIEGAHSPACMPEPNEDGNRIEVMDQYLMSCTRERAEEIAEIGANGDGGRKWAKRVEGKLVQEGGYDPIRGMGVRSIGDKRHGHVTVMER